MAKIYKRNTKGRMAQVYYQTSVFWFFAGVMVWLVAGCIGLIGVMLGRLSIHVQSIAIICMIAIMFGGLLVFVPVFAMFQAIKRSGGLRAYMYNRKSIRAVEDGLLSAGLVRKIVGEDVVEVPTCAIVVDKERTYITVERLPSLADSGKVGEAITSSLRVGRYADYAVSNPHETPDGLYYRYELVDVNRDLTYRPRTISDLVPSDPYKFQLMEGLEWSYQSQAHAIISGLTGSRKSSTMRAILAQALGAGADVYILDYKSEMIGFKAILGADHVVSDPADILGMLELLVQKMKVRHEEIAQLTVEKGLLGATGADFGARPVFIIAEELGGLTQAYTDAKERKRLQECLQAIAMLGRSCLFNLIVLLQIASVEHAPSGLKSNTNLKMLLGKSTSEMVTQVFSHGADVPLNPGLGRGYVYVNGETTTPTLYYTPDLRTNGLDRMETYCALYDIGRKRQYNGDL